MDFTGPGFLTVLVALFALYWTFPARWHSPSEYALYVTFFPKLISGPTERTENFLPQLREPKLVPAAIYLPAACMLAPHRNACLRPIPYETNPARTSPRRSSTAPRPSGATLRCGA